MAKQIAMRKVMGALRPCDGQEEAFNAIPSGDVIVEIKYANRPRSLRQLRLYWALMTIVANNTDYGWDVEQASDMLKIMAGHYRVTRTMDGEFRQDAKSIAIPAMGQSEFNAFFNALKDIVCERIIPCVSEADLRNELEMMVS